MWRTIIFIGLAAIATRAMAQNVTLPNYATINPASSSALTVPLNADDYLLADRLPGANVNSAAGGGYINVQQLANSISSYSVGQTSQQLVAISRQMSRLSQGIALASSITVLPPNLGDRFSVTFSGSGFNGYGAGSLAVTGRISENILAFAGYGRSTSQNLVKGGLSFSIH